MLQILISSSMVSILGNPQKCVYYIFYSYFLFQGVLQHPLHPYFLWLRPHTEANILLLLLRWKPYLSPIQYMVSILGHLQTDISVLPHLYISQVWPLHGSSTRHSLLPIPSHLNSPLSSFPLSLSPQDEPTSGMDPRSKRHLWKIISEEVKGKCAVVLTSHR